MPIFVISLMAIMSLVGATIALGMDSRSSNNLQHTADSAALGGATAFVTHPSPRAADRLDAARQQATVLAQSNSDYVLADLEVGAVTEDAYGQHTNLEVEVEAKPVNYFANFVGDAQTAPNRRRAVAIATWGFPLCVLTLEPKDTGLTVKDRAQLSAQNCIIWSNSTAKDSMKFDGGSASTKAFCTAGDVERDVKARVTPMPETGCQKLPDPLAGYDLPIEGLCDDIEVSVIKRGSTRLGPGNYCGGIEIKARNVTFEPGVYVIRGGGLKIDASGILLAEGVTFVFDGEIDKVEIKGDSGLTVTAPAEGATAGIAFAELDTVLPAFKDMKIEGQLNVEGVIYMPSYDIEIKKMGGGTTKSPYLQIVANSLELSDQGNLAIEFDMTQTDLPMVIKPAREARLVE
ncbi:MULTISPECIES: Tad domain-containing protein [Henriciella]|uniref:Putative Flp pilus-assembly TadG-like N-terminal domain-containing protein n=1 Tax=Henriciella pelagia TaxID=1977912 RepID=A0ABQ1JD54_9PROT|nr:Tad domain-containing protein [Henriciella pelagia]GGB65386.1 hypothetical protein GCM10011503_12750 [Henriciella pelagia]